MKKTEKYGKLIQVVQRKAVSRAEFSYEEKIWQDFYGDVPKKMEYPESSLWEMFEKSSLENAGMTAINYFGRKISYKKLYKKTLELAGSFAEIGIKKGSYVTVAVPNTPEVIMTFYALNMLGAVSNFIYPLSSVNEIKHFVEFSKSEFIVAAYVKDRNNETVLNIKSIADELNVSKIITVSPSDSMPLLYKTGYFFKAGRKIKKVKEKKFVPLKKLPKSAAAAAAEDFIRNAADETACVIYSGGTTDKPKGVMLSNLNFNALSMSGAAMTDCLYPGIRAICAMPVFHGFGLGILVHTALFAGSELFVVPDPRDFGSVTKLVKKNKINVIAGVPGFLNAVLSNKKLKNTELDFIKLVISGGDALPPQTRTDCDNILKEKKSTARIREGYGLTETVTGCCLNPKERIKAGSIGIPYPDTYMKVVGIGTEEELKPDETGEICISSPLIMNGYMGNKKETDEVLKKHSDGRIWLHTGDAGHMDSDGYFYFEYRIKRLIISSGFNINPVQTEDIINSHQGVADCAVIGVKNEYTGQKLKAFVVPKSENCDRLKLKEEILMLCKENLSNKSLPKDIEFKKELPKTKVGKVDWKALEELENSKGQENEKPI